MSGFVTAEDQRAREKDLVKKNEKQSKHEQHHSKSLHKGDTHKNRR